MRIWVRSLGCKVNLADTVELVEALLGAGNVCLVEEPGQADMGLLNTCTVTHKADRDARKILGALRRDHPGLPVVVTGCGAIAARESLERLPNVLKVIEPGNPQRVVEAVQRTRASAAGALQATAPDGYAQLGRQRAFLKIQDGCSSRCSYCIVPSVRGPERSVPIQVVLHRAISLFERGHREVVLSGIHLGRYGAGMEDGACLSDLVRKLEDNLRERALPGRIRLSSIEPMEVSDALIEVLAGSERVCPHFHVPLQSGDDQVLAAMGRPYRVEQFYKILEMLHRADPEAALGTDVLVGFPGETELQAQNTLNAVRQMPLSYLHVFSFSPRPGTLAADLPARVASPEMKNRSQALLKEGRERWRTFTHLGLNRDHQVLFEQAASGALSGRTEHYRKFRVAAGSGLRLGDLGLARAESVDGETLVGRPTRAAQEGPCLCD
jgi:threonylcarbamoyladenosine tRNA methylthiotransferase MtaB